MSTERKVEDANTAWLLTWVEMQGCDDWEANDAACGECLPCRVEALSAALTAERQRADEAEREADELEGALTAARRNQWAAERSLSEAREALAAEVRRRCFMSCFGRSLSWGPGSRRDSEGPPHVYFTDPDGDGMYRPVELEEPQGDDLAAAETRLIDRAIERIGMDATPSWSAAQASMRFPKSFGALASGTQEGERVCACGDHFTPNVNGASRSECWVCAADSDDANRRNVGTQEGEVGE